MTILDDARRLTTTDRDQAVSPGARFGLLTVIYRDHSPKPGQPMVWLVCRCDCGQVTSALRTRLVSGAKRSCGCMRRLPKTKIKHGHAIGGNSSKTHQAWCDMRARCRDPRLKSYKDYGGRGITVCERWEGKQGFQNFLEDMGEAPPGLTLERLDNDGNYEPGNCRWATRAEQNRNKRRPTVPEVLRRFDLEVPK